MLRISGLLTIALGIAASGLLSASASASSHTRTAVTPIQLPAGELPLPPRTPKVLPTYCETHNCIMPPRNLGGR